MEFSFHGGMGVIVTTAWIFLFEVICLNFSHPLVYRTVLIFRSTIGPRRFPWKGGVRLAQGLYFG